MTMYEIESGVELIRNEHRIRVKFDEPFDKMQLGDTFFLPMVPSNFEPRDGRKTSLAELKAAVIRKHARMYRDRIDSSFKVFVQTRTKEMHGECGLRVFRVARKAVDNAK